MWNTIRKIDSCNPNVWKYVFEKKDAVAESVLYRYPTFKKRTVICCSTQSGCPVGCRFCGAGDYFVRNLSTEEIVYQPSHLLNDVEFEGIYSDEIERLQIMFMSMGEPLLNQGALIPALYRLNEEYPLAALLISSIGPRISYDMINKVSVDISKIGLQFSIHESTDEKRNKLIPLAGKLTLAEIADAGIRWFNATGRKPFFNYCAHKDNISNEDVGNLYSTFAPEVWEATISVICERDQNICATNEVQRSLAKTMMDKLTAVGYSTRMFDPAGQDDIGGGCGQLWFVQDWMKNHPWLAKKSVGHNLPVIHTPA